MRLVPADRDEERLRIVGDSAEVLYRHVCQCGVDAAFDRLIAEISLVLGLRGRAVAVVDVVVDVRLRPGVALVVIWRRARLEDLACTDLCARTQAQQSTAQQSTAQQSTAHSDQVAGNVPVPSSRLTADRP